MKWNVAFDEIAIYAQRKFAETVSDPPSSIGYELTNYLYVPVIVFRATD